MWLMLDSAREAQKSGKKYFYMGTVYGEKALYKTNFDNIEHWNGHDWIEDKKKLRDLSRSDEKRVFNAIDEWKEGIEKF